MTRPRKLHLLRLYPRWWRARYGEEFTDLVDALSGGRRDVGLSIDVVRGALDAHPHGRPGRKGALPDIAARRGLGDGLIVGGVLVVAAVLSNVVFPAGPQDSDSDPGFLAGLLAGYLVLAVVVTVIGARAHRRSETPMAGVKGGAAAAVVIAALVTATFVVMNNLFFDIVSGQHDKRAAFAASGWSSMRAYLTVSQLEGAVVLIPPLPSSAPPWVSSAVCSPDRDRPPLVSRYPAPPSREAQSGCHPEPSHGHTTLISRPPSGCPRCRSVPSTGPGAARYAGRDHCAGRDQRC